MEPDNQVPEPIQDIVCLACVRREISSARTTWYTVGLALGIVAGWYLYGVIHGKPLLAIPSP